ncbi:hypothetical protein EG68_11992 [Paragonimus skrjabini miyazakii]|uniref:Uncharacterized protein n=1 Tax=Paragonimus skrjabini miyazakii TaxID=59628 RepID=A0A8S9YGL3_9TREM|nr:hypothetical protein EG68_11992 [Paragonimus skrjabini miyazakii]
MEWAAAKEALIAGFSSPGDCQEAKRRFIGARLRPEGVSLRAALPRTLPHLDQDSEQRMLTDQFSEGIPPTVWDKLKLAVLAHPIALE